MSLPPFRAETSSLCANVSCRHALPPNAKFCTRCGRAVAQAPAPPPLVPPRQPVRMQSAPPRAGVAMAPAGAMQPRRGAPIFRILFFLAAVVCAILVLSYWRNGGHLPGMNGATETPSTAPAIPSDGNGAPLPSSGWETSKLFTESKNVSYIQQPWVTNEFNEKSEYGLHLHAWVDPTNQGELRLVAHIRHSNARPVYATNSKYSDPQSQAGVARYVPVAVVPVEMNLFIPFSAMSLEKDGQDLEVLLELYDKSDRLVGPGKVLPFTR